MATPTTAPRDAAEAEQRFYARYGDTINARTWTGVQRYLGHLLPRPTTVEEWIAVAAEILDRLRAETAAQPAAQPAPTGIGRNTPRAVVPDAILLQWANGKPVARPLGKGRFAPHVGWHIEVGKDERLDMLLLGAGYGRLEFKHQRPGGAEIVQHWDLGATIDVLPITSGPVATTVAGSLANGAAAETAAAGLGAHWPKGEGERSQLAVRGFVKSLWDAGFTGLIQLGTKSRMTDWLLRALLVHTRAAVAADALVDQAKYPGRQVSPAELWLPLGGGDETEFGRGDTATVVPIVALHPDLLGDADYLRSCWAPAEVRDAAVQAWPLVQAWAKEYQLTGGKSADEPAE